MRRVVSQTITATLLSMVLAGCGFVRSVAPSASLVWAAQLGWSPNAAALGLQYNSATAGPYDATPTVIPSAGWQTQTWKLTNVHWDEGQNYGADLRLSGSPGVAVHEIVLSLNPPGKGGATARITLGGGTGSPSGIGPIRLVSPSQGIVQVGSGGSQGDSAYKVEQVDGKGAEVLDDKGLGGDISYIYLQLSPTSALRTDNPTTVYATVTYTALYPPQPWPVSTFAAMAAKGIHRAEINMEWSSVEPSPGHFDFTLLDGDLANAAKAGVKVIPIFWYSVWNGNPASWITDYDVGSNGITSQVPVWWSASNRQAYFTYIQQTIAHIKDSPGFGGAFLDYGWLDYMWGPTLGGSGVNGYAPADVARFHQWLPTHYHSLAAFNTEYGTGYTAWADVPAATPGQALFPVYQAFRDWSVQETYARMSAIYRKETNAPLYFYWGGSFSGFGSAFNLPDTFFAVAKQYHGTVVLDDANWTGLPILFGSLARAYGVPLFEEWTPNQTGLHAEIAEFMGHFGFEFPEAAGMDFFLYDGGQDYNIGFPVYTAAIPLLSQMKGTYPQQPVAIYISYDSIFTNPGALSGTQNLLATLWRQDPTGVSVVTSAELSAGVVHLSSFQAVYPLTGASDPVIMAYAAHGGHVVSSPTGLLQYAHPYANLAPSTQDVEVVPTVDASEHTAWMTVAGVNPSQAWTGQLTLNFAGLGLPAGSYRLVNLATGKTIAATVTAQGLTVSLAVPPGFFEVWHLVPAAAS